VSGAELITRRRKWSPTQKAALLEEVEDEGVKVAVIARRHGLSESLLYNWRSITDRPVYPRRRRRIMATLAEGGGRCRPPVSKEESGGDGVPWPLHVGAWDGRGVIAGASGSASFRPRRSRQGRIRLYTWRQGEPRPHLERVRC
jgi:hypothetical protein